MLFRSIGRIGQPREILAGPMLLIASLGLLVNLSALGMLWSGRRHDLNVRGAWLHVASDALGSIGAIGAARAIGLIGAIAALAPLARGGRAGYVGAAAIAAWLSVIVSAAACAVELGVSGTSPLSVALPAMVGVHILIGLGEAAITAAALSFIRITNPGILATPEAGR